MSSAATARILIRDSFSAFEDKVQIIPNTPEGRSPERSEGEILIALITGIRGSFKVVTS